MKHIKLDVKTMKIHYYENNEFSENVFIIDMIEGFNIERLDTEE